MWEVMALLLCFCKKGGGRSHSREKQHRTFRESAAEVYPEVYPAHLWHHDVCDKQIGCAAICGIERIEWTCISCGVEASHF